MALPPIHMLLGTAAAECVRSERIAPWKAWRPGACMAFVPDRGTAFRLAMGHGAGSVCRAESVEELVQILATADYCSAEIRRELARTPAFQKRLQAVDLMPKPGDRGWTRWWWADKAKVVLAAFELEVPPPPKPRRRR